MLPNLEKFSKPTDVLELAAYLAEKLEPTAREIQNSPGRKQSDREAWTNAVWRCFKNIEESDAQ